MSDKIMRRGTAHTTSTARRCRRACCRAAAVPTRSARSISQLPAR
jgi:hypothetical protein